MSSQTLPTCPAENRLSDFLLLIDLRPLLCAMDAIVAVCPFSFFELPATGPATRATPSIKPAKSNVAAPESATT